MNSSLTAVGETIIQQVPYSIAGQAVAVRVTGDPEAANNGLFYIHSDHLGSTSVLTKYSDGYIRADSLTRYTPFGAYRTGGPNPLTDRAFTGQKENMSGLGLYYYQARFYAPGLGRFLSADTIVPDPQNPQQFNRYAYSLNSPLNYSDPTGHEPRTNPVIVGGGSNCDPMYDTCMPSPFDSFTKPNHSQVANGFIADWCISMGDLCPSDVKFRYFDIPSTEEQFNMLVMAEAQSLCMKEYCGIQATGMMLGLVTIPLGPASKLGYVGTFMEAAVAVFREDYNGAVGEFGMDAFGEITDELVKSSIPIGGIAWEGIDVATSGSPLSSIDRKYWREAGITIPLQVNQSKTEFMDMHRAYISGEPYTKPWEQAWFLESVYR